MLIRPIWENEDTELWRVMEAAVRAGETLAVPTNATPEEAVEWWIGGKEAVFVAIENDQIVGSYYLRPNQTGNASHIANAGYIVSDTVRNRGIATALCGHSLEEAQRRGYRAMQFNFVVETNTGAVRLWEKMGFRIMATIPRAFRHPTKGSVGAHIMWQSFEDHD